MENLSKISEISFCNFIRGVTWKSGPGVKSSNFSANIRPTETYYIPNQWKLIKVFDELCRFKITALIE